MLSKVTGRGQKLETLGMPTWGPEFEAIRDSLRSICEAVAKEPPVPGDRRHSSKKGLVMGDPMLPIVRQILKAANRPRTSLEVGPAFLQVRELELDPRSLTALVNRLFAKPSYETKQGRVQRLRIEGRKLVSLGLSEGAATDPSAPEAVPHLPEFLQLPAERLDRVAMLDFRSRCLGMVEASLAREQWTAPTTVVI